MNENLLVGLPAGFKIAFQDRKPNVQMTEAIPSNETLRELDRDGHDPDLLRDEDTPDQFRSRLEQCWRAACADGRGDEVTKGAEKGYPFAIFVLSCPLNPKTGKPEITWFKAVQGNDSFYLVQKAFKYMPSKDQVALAMKYLGAVTVCDSRLADRRCPLTQTIDSFTQLAGSTPCPPSSSSAPPSPIPRSARRSTNGMPRSTCRMRRKSSARRRRGASGARAIPSVHQATYQFADRAALDHGTRPENMTRLVADFDKAWPAIKRSREIMTLAQEWGA